MSTTTTDFVANRKRLSNFEFGQLIPKLSLADILLIEVKVNGFFWCRLIRVLSPATLIFECVVCHEEIKNPKQLILHLNGKEHATEVKYLTDPGCLTSWKQLYHPVYTFNKNAYIFMVCHPDGPDTNTTCQQQAITEAENSMLSLPKSVFLCAHVMATKVEDYVQNLGESIPENECAIEFSAKKVIDNAKPEELNQTELSLKRRSIKSISKTLSTYDRLIKEVAKADGKKHFNKSQKSLKQIRRWNLLAEKKAKLTLIEHELSQEDYYLASDDAGGDAVGLTEYEPRTAAKDVLPKAKTPHISMESLAGIIGVEYVVRLIDLDTEGGDSCMWYVCTLCDKRLNSVAMHDHILDCNHRYLYCMEHYPTCMEQYFSYGSTEKKRQITMKNVVTILANVIESHHGRALPHYCHASEYKHNPDAIKHIIFNAEHASEKNGPTFVDHIQKNEINDLPHRTFLMSTLNDSQVSRHFNRLPENAAYMGKAQIPGISEIPSAIECDQSDDRDVRLRKAWESKKLELKSSPRYQKPPVAGNNNNDNSQRKEQTRSRSPPNKGNLRNVNDNFQPTQRNGDKRLSRRDISSEPEIIPTLRLMMAFKDLLGSLGPKVIDLFSETLLIGKTEPTQLNSKILTFKNCLLLETAVEKLKGVLEAESIQGSKLMAINNVIRQTTDLIAYGEKIGGENPSSLPSGSVHPSMDLKTGKTDLLKPHQWQTFKFKFSQSGGNIKSSLVHQETNAKSGDNSAISNQNQNYTRANNCGRDMNLSTTRSGGVGRFDDFGSNRNSNSTFPTFGGNNYRSGIRNNNFYFDGNSSFESTLSARRGETYDSKSGSSGYDSGNNFNTNMRGYNIKNFDFPQPNNNQQEYFLQGGGDGSNELSQIANRNQHRLSNSYNSQMRGSEFFNSSRRDDVRGNGIGSNTMLHKHQNWNPDQQNYTSGSHSKYSGNWGNN